MNEHMNIGAHGLKLIAAFEGKPRLNARLCEGGRYELSYGCTTWPDGRAVGSADVCTEDQALQLFAFHLHRFEAVVEKYTTVELNQFQYDAHVALAYNIGEGQYRSSSVLRFTNERRWEDAAAAFSLFVWATSSRPSEIQKKAKSLQPIIGADGRWKGPDGQPCDYRQAFEGLKKRHDCEGLLSLGLDWSECKVSLDAERVWDGRQNRWEDVVTDATPFAKVKEKALLLPRLVLADPPAQPVTPNKPFDLDGYEKAADAAIAAAKAAREAKPPVSGAVVAAPPAKTPVAPLPAPPRPLPPPPAPYVPEYQVPKGAVTPGVPPQAKPQEATRRFWGAFLFYGGKLVMLLGVSTLPGKFAIAFGETWGAVVKDPQLFGMAIDALCFSTGFVADHCGAWIRKWGERKATRPMVSGGESAQVTVLALPAPTASMGGQ